MLWKELEVEEAEDRESPFDFDSICLLSNPEVVPKIQSTPLLYLLPQPLQIFVSSVCDVIADGNCGYRVIANYIYGEPRWIEVRLDLLREIEYHRARYIEIYTLRRVVEIENTLTYFVNGSFAPMQYWMTLPDMGLMIASYYNVVVFLISNKGSQTFLPLFSAAPTTRREVAIGFVRNDHFIQINLHDDFPVPPIDQSWERYHSPKAAGWAVGYDVRRQCYNEIMGHVEATQILAENIKADYLGCFRCGLIETEQKLAEMDQLLSKLAENMKADYLGASDVV